jgi:hypothetical protein
MTIAMQPIYTQTVGSGGAATVTFNSIPQTFTDLCIIISARCAAGTTNETGTLKFNSDSGNNYSARRLVGSGTSAGSASFSATASMYAFYPAQTSTTANTFSSIQIYVPNYASSNQKSVSSDSVEENNATAANSYLTAGLWTGTSAITSISLGVFTGSFVQNSTFSLYGITKG